MTKKKLIISSTILESLNQDKGYPEVPDVVYHGQPPSYENGKRIEPEIIVKFNQNKKRFLEKHHFGFYFTPDKHMAIRYAEGGNVYSCRLNVKNPYYYEWLFHYNNGGLISNPAFITKKDVDLLLQNGFDSIAVLNPMKHIDEIIVFNPDQIEILKIE